MAFGMRARGESREDAIGSPAEFAHAEFGGVVGAGDPVFEMIEVFMIGGLERGKRCQQVVELGWRDRDYGGVKSSLGI